MKIAFIYDAMYPWVKGGAERRVYELAKRLVAKGHEVHCYSLGWWWPEKGERDIKMDGIILHGVSKPLELYSDDRRSIKEARSFGINLLRPLMKEDFDVIDCQGFPYFSSFTSRLHELLGKSSLVITLHEVWGDYWYDYLGRAGIFGKLVERSMLAMTDKFITVSKKTDGDLHKIKKTSNSVVIPNGIDYDSIQKIKPSSDNSDILFVGRLIKEKNVETLLRALPSVKKKFPDFNCVVVGDGPEKNKLEKLVENLGLSENVSFTGFMENYTDIIAHMKSTKVFVLPSIREGFGMVVIESNACGVPVVVVNHPMNAAQDLVVDGVNGYISEPEPELMAGIIVKSIENKDKMRDKCLEISMEYDWDKIVNSLLEVYKGIM
jgi:glycosyltransferase involved in cell wall biosynthesis